MLKWVISRGLGQCALEYMLKGYEKALSKINEKFDGKTLSQLNEQETDKLISICKSVTDLTKSNKVK
ncbi:MAG: hypothetical protein P8179_23950 [Candidatus Thiodiazotropha sp.]|jgi:hypothetical protein